MWDLRPGWIGSCQPVICGEAKAPAHAEALQDVQALQMGLGQRWGSHGMSGAIHQDTAVTKVFSDTVEYVCAAGYATCHAYHMVL